MTTDEEGRSQPESAVRVLIRGLTLAAPNEFSAGRAVGALRAVVELLREEIRKKGPTEGPQSE